MVIEMEITNMKSTRASLEFGAGQQQHKNEKTSCKNQVKQNKG